jgi:predicted transcriptional regulator
MTSLTIDLPDEKLERLQALARDRGTDVAHLIDEMSSILLAEADADTRFRLRAARGAAREERGLELLRKAAGQSNDG